MAKYSVRLYSTYCDEFEVEAESEDDAIELAEKYQCFVEVPNDSEGVFEGGKVERLIAHAYVDSEHPCVNALDADGNWIE